MPAPRAAPARQSSAGVYVIGGVEDRTPRRRAFTFDFRAARWATIRGPSRASISAPRLGRLVTRSPAAQGGLDTNLDVVEASIRAADVARDLPGSGKRGGRRRPRSRRLVSAEGNSRPDDLDRLRVLPRTPGGGSSRASNTRHGSARRLARPCYALAGGPKPGLTAAVRTSPRLGSWPVATTRRPPVRNHVHVSCLRYVPATPRNSVPAEWSEPPFCASDRVRRGFGPARGSRGQAPGARR